MNNVLNISKFFSTEPLVMCPVNGYMYTPFSFLPIVQNLRDQAKSFFTRLFCSIVEFTTCSMESWNYCYIFLKAYGNT